MEKRLPTQVLSSAVLLGTIGFSPMPQMSLRQYTIPSPCQHFLQVYSPSVDKHLVDAETELAQQNYTFFTILPDPNDAAQDITVVENAIDTSSQVNSIIKNEINSSRRDILSLSPNFPKDIEQIKKVRQELQAEVAKCEHDLPKSQRKDGWRQGEKLNQWMQNFWDQGVPFIIIVLGIIASDIIIAEEDN